MWPQFIWGMISQNHVNSCLWCNWYKTLSRFYLALWYFIKIHNWAIYSHAVYVFNTDRKQINLNMGLFKHFGSIGARNKESFVALWLIYILINVFPKFLSAIFFFFNLGFRYEADCLMIRPVVTFSNSTILVE